MNATLAMRKRNRFLATLCCLAFAPARAALAQPAAPENNFAVRVDGAQNAVFEDQFCLRCDDAVAGAGSEACDVGQGAFTYELWIRAAALTNANTSSRGLDVEVFAYDWIDGNIILDRDVWAGTCDGHDFGAAILDGRIAFGREAVSLVRPSPYTATQRSPTTNGIMSRSFVNRASGCRFT